jgi:hypothetical protein
MSNANTLNVLLRPAAEQSEGAIPYDKEENL